MIRKNILIILPILALCYIVVLYFGQQHLYLFPDKLHIAPHAKNILFFKEIYFPAADGTMIRSWYATGNPQKPAIIFFHGNTGQIAEFAPLMVDFVKNGYAVFMPEYRGFAGQPGIFSQENIYSDAVNAYDFLKLNLGHDHITAFGYSLGTAPALYLSHQRYIRELILVAPFYSLQLLSQEKNIPFASFLLKDKFPSYLFIKNYTNPLLIIFGTKDTLISPHHGQILLDISQAKDKTLKLIRQQTHRGVFFSGEATRQALIWLKNKH